MAEIKAFAINTETHGPRNPEATRLTAPLNTASLVAPGVALIFNYTGSEHRVMSLDNLETMNNKPKSSLIDLLKIQVVHQI